MQKIRPRAIAEGGGVVYAITNTVLASDTAAKGYLGQLCFLDLWNAELTGTVQNTGI